MESMLPAVIPENRFGRPRAANASALCQSGWAMMPTRKPCASRTRPTIAIPKLGWSTYASPVTMMMSQLSQPKASISARDMGKNGAVPKRSAQYRRYPVMSRAVCMVWRGLDQKWLQETPYLGGRRAHVKGMPMPATADSVQAGGKRRRHARMAQRWREQRGLGGSRPQLGF